MRLSHARTLNILVPVVLALLTFNSLFAGEMKRQPNIVFILADDLGWSDTTLFGTTKLYKTPNIERLSKRGMTFPNAYSSSPLCSPTRASILTGLSPARIGLTAPNCHLPQIALKASVGKSGAPNMKAVVPSSVTRLDKKYYTLSEALKDNGYTTGHFGKWHLGIAPYSPLEHGFDVDIPHWHGPGPAGSFVAPWKFPDFDPLTPKEHIEDRMAQEAVTFMEKNKDESFFLNYWMFSVHAPFDAKKELIDEYRKIVDKNDPQRSPTYAAMIESMDDAVGTLLDAIDRLKLANDTIIVFASDNGGNMYNEIDDTTPTSNAPLRGGKATMYEGGVRGPGIFVVPGLVEPGSKNEAITQSSDYYPTFLELLNIKPKAKQNFDGISIVPALKGKSLDRKGIFTYFPHSPGVPDWLPPAVSVHSGDWKLIRIFHGGEKKAHRWKLFNLKNDVGEKNNLADKHPARVKELDAMIEEFLVNTKAVVPVPNPNFKPALYDIKDEGISKMKKPKRRLKPSKPVAGWHAGGTSDLKLAKDSLDLISDGGDPFMFHNFKKKLPPGKYTVTFKYKSTSQGFGQLFWKSKVAFSKAQSKNFTPKHDGEAHLYSVFFQSKEPVNAIRIDPSRGSGKTSVYSVSVTNAGGKNLLNWTP